MATFYQSSTFCEALQTIGDNHLNPDFDWSIDRSG